MPLPLHNRRRSLYSPATAQRGATMDADETAAEAIARLYADYAPSIVRHLERLTHDRETAEDLAQETFVKALRDPGQVASVDNVRAWLFRVRPIPPTTSSGENAAARPRR